MKDNQNKQPGNTPFFETTLPNGCTLYRRLNEAGGYTYLSDEIGGGVLVWDTALIDPVTLLAAIVDYNALCYAERHEAAKIDDAHNFTCDICNAVRPPRYISIRKIDLSEDYDYKSGTVVFSLAYCNDNIECVKSSKEQVTP